MNVINNLTKSFDDVLKLDKELKKSYNKRNKLQETINVFDDDALANSALDYLYSNDNKSKTQSFLKNNGFPSVGERQFNKELYGAQAEQKQMRDLLKSKTNGIINSQIPDATDRAFFKRSYGRERGRARLSVADIRHKPSTEGFAKCISRYAV